MLKPITKHSSRSTELSKGAVDSTSTAQKLQRPYRVSHKTLLGDLSSYVKIGPGGYEKKNVINFFYEKKMIFGHFFFFSRPALNFQYKKVVF